MTAVASRGATFDLTVRVYYEDTDAGGVVYYGNYLRFLERARTEWLRALGFEQAGLLVQERLAFAVRSVAAEYLLPARLDDLLNVSAKIESLGRAQVTFSQEVRRGDTVLVTATVRVACLDLDRGRAAPMPKAIYETFKALL